MNLFFSSNGFRHETDHIYRKKITVNLSCWHFHGICPERVGLYKHICFCSTHDLKSWSMCWKFLQCILETPEAYVEVLAAYVGKSCSLCWIILQRILEHVAAYDVKSCSLFWKVLQHMMENFAAYVGNSCIICWTSFQEIHYSSATLTCDLMKEQVQVTTQCRRSRAEIHYSPWKVPPSVGERFEFLFR